MKSPLLALKGVRLPNAERAFVDLAKLRGYCLNPNHFRGRHKARVFAAALGFTAEDAELFKSIILRSVLNTDAVMSGKDRHGQRYSVDFLMGGPKGHAIVRSSWIILTGEEYPRFLSCYVLS
jgi:hypothetical protein